MRNNNIEKILNSLSRINIEPPKSLDFKVYNLIYRKDFKNKIYLNFYIKTGIALASIFLIFFIYQIILNPLIFYNKIMNEIVSLYSSRDVKKIVNIYSKNFYGSKIKDIEKNVKLLFNYYKNIDYKTKKEKVILKNNYAIIINSFYYRALPIYNNLKELKYSGREKIFLIKENGSWKIIGWYYE
jgi:hypothetical protein